MKSKKIITVTHGCWTYSGNVDCSNFEVDINTILVENQGKPHSPDEDEIDGIFFILHSIAVGRIPKGMKAEITEMP